MKTSTQAALLLVASLSPALAPAQDPAPARGTPTADTPHQEAPVQATDRPAPASSEMNAFDQQMIRTQQHLHKLQAQMESIQQSEEPNERQRLLREHWSTMQEVMRMMHGPGRMGGPMMEAGKGMGWKVYAELSLDERAQRLYMMERRLEIQQMLLEHMALHHQQLQESLRADQPAP